MYSEVIQLYIYMSVCVCVCVCVYKFFFRFLLVIYFIYCSVYMLSQTPSLSLPLTFPLW